MRAAKEIYEELQFWKGYRQAVEDGGCDYTIEEVSQRIAGLEYALGVEEE